MTYLDYINSIYKYQGGGSTPNPWVEFAKDITPGLGTYRAFQRAKEDPRFGTYLDVGLSALGDIGTLTGVGAIAKGAILASKAGKAAKAANTAAKVYNGAQTANNFNRFYKNAQTADRLREASDLVKWQGAEDLIWGTSANVLPGLNKRIRQESD